MDNEAVVKANELPTHEKPWVDFLTYIVNKRNNKNDYILQIMGDAKV